MALLGGLSWGSRSKSPPENLGRIEVQALRPGCGRRAFVFSGVQFAISHTKGGRDEEPYVLSTSSVAQGPTIPDPRGRGRVGGPRLRGMTGGAICSNKQDHQSVTCR